MGTCKSLLGVRGTGHGTTSCCWDGHEYRTGAQVAGLGTSFQNVAKVFKDERCFFGKLDLAPGIALSCLLTTLVDEVLYFVLLLPFEILRHHLPI